MLSDYQMKANRNILIKLYINLFCIFLCLYKRQVEHMLLQYMEPLSGLDYVGYVFEYFENNVKANEHKTREI